MTTLVGRLLCALLVLLLLGCQTQSAAPDSAAPARADSNGDKPLVIVDSFAVPSLDPVTDGVPVGARSTPFTGRSSYAMG
jgi:hypothetical protein